jgi:hypothetical protein
MVITRVLRARVRQALGLSRAIEQDDANVLAARALLPSWSSGPSLGPMPIPWDTSRADWFCDAGHPRTVVAEIEASHAHDYVCLGCALNVLESFEGAGPLWWRDLILIRFDRVGLHLYFRSPGEFRCECACDHCVTADAGDGGIAIDRLVCRKCLTQGHVIETTVQVAR